MEWDVQRDANARMVVTAAMLMVVVHAWRAIKASSVP